jgi:hypothetical protein
VSFLVSWPVCGCARCEKDVDRTVESLGVGVVARENQGIGTKKGKLSEVGATLKRVGVVMNGLRSRECYVSICEVKNF